MKTFNELMDNGTMKELYDFVKENAVGDIYYLTDEDKVRVEEKCSNKLGGSIYVSSPMGRIYWDTNNHETRSKIDKTLLWGLTFGHQLEPLFTIYGPYEKAEEIERHKARMILLDRELNPPMAVPADVPTNNIVNPAPPQPVAPPPLLEQVAAADAPVETTVPGNTPVMYVANRWGVDLCKVDVPDYRNTIERVTALGHSGLGSIFSDPVANYASVAVAMTFKLGSFSRRNHIHTLLRISLSNLQPYIFELHATQLDDGRTYIDNNEPVPNLEKEFTIRVDYNFGESEVEATLYDSDGNSSSISHAHITPSTHELLFVQFGSSEEGLFSTRPDDTSMPMYGMKIIERSVTLVK